MKRTVSIVKGTAVLTAAGFTVKVFGAIYRILLSRMIGAEGIGLYQMAYPVYLIFLSLSTAGIPIAISKIIAEKSASGDRIGMRAVFRAAFGLMFLLGTLSSAAMAGTARWFASHVVFDPRAIFAIWALSPAIFFMSLMAVFRGFFQGQLYMQPSAVSQIFEQLVRVGVSIFLAYALLPMGIEHAAAGAAFGATAGGAAGLVYLVYVYWRNHHSAQNVVSKVGRKDRIILEMRRLIRFALPISLTAILMPLLQTLDSVLVPHRLQSIGYTIKQSTTMLGILGNSWAVIYLPLIVTGAMAANMVPAVSILKESRDRLSLQNKVSEGLRLTMIYLCPASVGLLVFGGTVYRMIYGDPGITVLSWFSPAIFFLGLEQVSAGVLQGLGKPKWPLFSFVIGAVIKIAVTTAATGWPGLNLAGAALGTVSGALVTASLNLCKIRQMVRFRVERSGAVILAGCAMFLACRYLRKIWDFSLAVEFVSVGFAGVIVYGAALWLTGGIRLQDLEVITQRINKKGTWT